MLDTSIVMFVLPHHLLTFQLTDAKWRNTCTRRGGANGNGKVVLGFWLWLKE